jgi:hypothetical protein
MPDRDERTPDDAEQKDLEQDARESDDVPEGSNPDSQHHESAKGNLEDAKAENGQN